MQESFGARLRQQREKKGISLRTIASQTKIKLSLLEGLERDDISHWPAGIFRRAYVRDYAQAIGLDPDVVVREFVERYPAPIEVPEPPPPQPGRFRSLVDTALGSLLARAPDLDARLPGAAPRPADVGSHPMDAAIPSAAGPRIADIALPTSGVGHRTSDGGSRISNVGRRPPEAGPRSSSGARRSR